MPGFYSDAVSQDLTTLLFVVASLIGVWRLRIWLATKGLKSSCFCLSSADHQAQTLTCSAGLTLVPAPYELSHLSGHASRVSQQISSWNWDGGGQTQASNKVWSHLPAVSRLVSMTGKIFKVQQECTLANVLFCQRETLKTHPSTTYHYYYLIGVMAL